MNELSTNFVTNRSKLYHIDTPKNPIIAATAPIVSLINRISTIPAGTPEPENWQEICQHEVQICLNRCENSGYNSKELEYIKTILLSWLNTNCIWPFKYSFKEYSNLTYDLILAKVDDNINIIELIYILNRLGLPLDNNQHINEIKVQELYYLIQGKNQNTKNSLQQQLNIEQWRKASMAHKRNNNHWALFLTLGMCLCLYGLWSTLNMANAIISANVLNTQVFL